MPRKVFISVLGTGFYGKCQYVSEDFKSSSTRFVQRATLEWLKADQWGCGDAVYIFLTEKSRSDNWEVEGNIRKNNKGEICDYHGLRNELEPFLPFPPQTFDIPDGKDEKEIWDIFQIIFEQVEEGDELYFDLTHGFRYLPMLVLVLGNYAKFLRHVKVMSVSYGNFEARDRETNEAPFVNLLPLSSLQDWTFAAADFLENGYADRLTALTNSELSPILRNDKLRTSEILNLKKFVGTLQKMSRERLTCRGLDVYDNQAMAYLESLLPLVDSEVIGPMAPVLNKLRNVYLADSSTRKNVGNLFMAVDWCLKYNLYQQAVTFLEEGVVSLVCVRNGIDMDDRDKRGVVNSVVCYLSKSNSSKELRVDEKLKGLFYLVVADLRSEEELVTVMGQLMDLRNDFNHCGMRKGSLPIEAIIRNTHAIYEKIRRIMSHYNADTALPGKHHVFVNLSNHPYEYWEETQKKAASEYGEASDLPFPSILPDASEEEINALADEYLERIVSMAPKDRITVHIMGEMTFTFAMVERLKSMGIRCVASTTERVVEEHEGLKTSVFSFVRFRDY